MVVIGGERGGEKDEEGVEDGSGRTEQEKINKRKKIRRISQ